MTDCSRLSATPTGAAAPTSICRILPASSRSARTRAIQLVRRRATYSYTLDVTNLPAHAHPITDVAHSHTAYQSGHSHNLITGSHSHTFAEWSTHIAAGLVCLFVPMFLTIGKTYIRRRNTSTRGISAATPIRQTGRRLAFNANGTGLSTTQNDRQRRGDEHHSVLRRAQLHNSISLMSTQFRPLEIPPGVVAKATKQQRSSNWAEVNLFRWTEGQMTPVGGQSQYNFTFASRCKQMHGWFGLNGVYHIAYLCERHLYVDTAGVLTDISPTPPITSPTPVGQGGYGDGSYSVGMELATTAFAAGATAITMQQPNPGWVQPTMDIYNVTQSLHVGKVLTFTGTALVLAAGAEHAAALGDELMFDWYGKPRPVDSVAALDKIPSWYSLDNFGSILYAMTSADGRLLMWDPAVGGAAVVQPADDWARPCAERALFRRHQRTLYHDIRHRLE